MKDILKALSEGRLTVDEAERVLSSGMVEMGFANIDTGREGRVGFPEVVFCQGKTTEQITEILQTMERAGIRNILATRAGEDIYDEVKRLLPGAVYHPLARAIVVNGDRAAMPPCKGPIAVVTAGTADIPVAEEAAVTAETFGNDVTRIYDVGVAGIHRLLARLDDIRAARVVVCVAGMEGALASVVGGLVKRPVIAVPTSVGYGASFSGLSALLTMLNSCAAGVSVVNIDNGFGAGYMAATINRL